MSLPAAGKYLNNYAIETDNHARGLGISQVQSSRMQKGTQTSLKIGPCPQ